MRSGCPRPDQPSRVRPNLGLAEILLDPFVLNPKLNSRFYMEFLVVLYFCGIVGVAIFVLTLLSRFVRAHERVADALHTIARKFRDDEKR